MATEKTHGRLHRPIFRLSAAPDPDAVLVQRWAQIARDVDPRLLAGQDWPRLAVALTRADAAGYNVAEGLPRLAAEAALPEHRPGAEMYWRLLDDCRAAAPPHVRRQAREPAYVPEHIRRQHEPPPGSRPDPDRSGPDR